MNKELFVGVDLGGTHIRVALVDPVGKIVHGLKTPTSISSGATQAAQRLVEACLDQISVAADWGCQVKAVGLGVAGKVDRQQGKVIFSPNLMPLNGYPLARELETQLCLPVVMENDANVFGVGESWLGAGRNIANWIGLTLGTGVGGCLILNGKLWTGDDLGFSGEIGHMVIDPRGPLCACGLRGCLEAYASGRALLEGVGRAIVEGKLKNGPLYDMWHSGELTPEAVQRFSATGEPVAVELFHRFGSALGLALANLFTVLGIRHAILGGGVSASWDQFIASLQKSLIEHSSMLARGSARILRSSLGDDAALLGAARLAAHHFTTVQSNLQ